MLIQKHDNIYEILYESSKKAPKKIALIEGREKISYESLLDRVLKVISFFKAIGVRKDDKIALVLSNSQDFIISIFAASKVQAIVIPINIMLKKYEIEFILKDSKANFIISSSKFKNKVRDFVNLEHVEKIMWTDNINKNLLDFNNISFYAYKKYKTQRDSYKNISFEKKDVLAIFYTSGTTGKPKGAMIMHKNIISTLISLSKVFNIKQRDRFIVFLPMFQVFPFLTTVMLPIFNQASTVVIKSMLPFSNIIKSILFKRVTIVVSIPLIYNVLLSYKLPLYFMLFNRVRVFVSGASALNSQMASRFKKKFKRAFLIEGYGLSECASVVSVNTLKEQRACSVGLALPPYKIKIVNDDMVEVPIGSTGEILVKGDCVMLGYFNNQEATDKTIVNGWLKTGDIGKLDKDGYIYILDRKKDLIISKGINIYPREIEDVLYDIEGVELAAILGMKNKNSEDETPVAFIKVDDIKRLKNKTITESYIKKRLKSSIANFKIPRRIYFVEDMPRNILGKVLKRELKKCIDDDKLAIYDI